MPLPNAPQLSSPNSVRGGRGGFVLPRLLFRGSFLTLFGTVVGYAGCTAQDLHNGEENRVSAQRGSEEPSPHTKICGNLIGRPMQITAFDAETKTVHSVILHIDLDSEKKFIFRLNGQHYDVDYTNGTSRFCVNLISTIEKSKPGADTVITSKKLNNTTLNISDTDLGSSAIDADRQLKANPDKIVLRLVCTFHPHGPLPKALAKEYLKGEEKGVLVITLLKRQGNDTVVSR